MSVYVSRFKSEYLIRERLVRKAINITNTVECKMMIFSAGSELKKAQTPT